MSSNFLISLQSEDPTAFNISSKRALKIEKQRQLDEAAEARRQRLRTHVKATRLREWELATKKKEEKEKEESKSSGDIALLSNMGLAILNELHREKEEDHHTLFCLSLASKLRTFPKKEGRKVTLQILHLVSDVEDQLEETQSKDRYA